MNPVATILWEAAADVEQRGVTRPPRFGETCAAVAVSRRAESLLRHSGGPWERSLAGDRAKQVLRHTLGLNREVPISPWNDAQPSRAVVAAAMRDAAFLAEWAGPHLLGSRA